MATLPRTDSPVCNRVRSKESEAAGKEKGIWCAERLSEIRQCCVLALCHQVRWLARTTGRWEMWGHLGSRVRGFLFFSLPLPQHFFLFLSYWSFTPLHPDCLLVYGKSHLQVLSHHRKPILSYWVLCETVFFFQTLTLRIAVVQKF